jgi:hypothetical protein
MDTLTTIYDLESYFSPKQIIIFILSTILLFGILKVTNILLFSRIKKTIFSKQLQQIYPFVELVIWLTYFMFYIERLWQGNKLLSIILIVFFSFIMLYIGWKSIKELIVGIIMRLINMISVGEHIEIKGVNGKIVDLKSQYILVQEINNELVKVPYSKIWGKFLKKTIDSGYLLNTEIEVERKADDKDVETVKHELLTTILNTPWISVKINPDITFVSQNENKLKFRLKIYAIEKEQLSLISSYIKSLMSNQQK